MLNNTVDSKKRKGTGMDDTIFVATSPETSNKDNQIARYTGKFEMGIIANFGPNLDQYGKWKYEDNTPEQNAQRMAKRNKTRSNGEGFTH